MGLRFSAIAEDKHIQFFRVSKFSLVYCSVQSKMLFLITLLLFAIPRQMMAEENLVLLMYFTAFVNAIVFLLLNYYHQEIIFSSRKFTVLIEAESV